MPNVPPPSSGLGSNSNYFLNNNCNNLNGVAITIGVSTDIVPSAGFGMQLNAYSPQNETCAIQQYVIAVDTSGQMTCIVNNWQSASNALINNWVSLYKLPSATLPAGHQCRIALQNDNTGNITAATYTVSMLAVAPAAGGALTSFADSYGEHAYYIGADQHVHQLYFDNKTWVDQDLTAATKGPEAANGSALSSFDDSYGEHAYYIGADQHVHQLYFSGTWVDQDLTAWVLASVTQTLSAISGVSSADLSPIVAFELDIVGYDNGQSTTLSSGSGTITYTAADTMAVVNAEPACCEFDGGTLETANTAYGELPTGSSATFVQTFGMSAAIIKAPKRNGLTKTRPPRAATAITAT